MGSGQRQYTVEFKREAVALTNSSETVTEVARDLGIPANTLYKWRSELKQEASDSKSTGIRTSLKDEEIRRLERENKKLRAERDFLKKAAAFFAKEGSNGTNA